MFLAGLCLIATLPYRVAAQQDPSPNSTVSDFQKDFAAAYNRGDVDAMAGAFTESAIRVTPSGIFEGRDAIRRGFSDALNRPARLLCQTRPLAFGRPLRVQCGGVAG